jgi:hypothetical protein
VILGRSTGRIIAVGVTLRHLALHEQFLFSRPTCSPILGSCTDTITSQQAHFLCHCHCHCQCQARWIQMYSIPRFGWKLELNCRRKAKGKRNTYTLIYRTTQGGRTRGGRQLFLVQGIFRSRGLDSGEDSIVVGGREAVGRRHRVRPPLVPHLLQILLAVRNSLRSNEERIKNLLLQRQVESSRA